MNTDVNTEFTPVAVLLGITADIGIALAEKLIAEGWFVIGLGRTPTRLSTLITNKNFKFIDCDVSDPSSISNSFNTYKIQKKYWSLFVSCIGTMEPIGPFFKSNFEDWERSITINFLGQLRVLHAFWKLRIKFNTAHVMFLAGGGTNNPFTNYSAYCVSKIGLIKMCELIDDEEDECNIFIIGPGFVKTRIHNETLNAKELSGQGYAKTIDFLKTEGTSYDDIYNNLKWCMTAGRAIAGGRNFSTVHDPWKNNSDELKRSLNSDSDAFKLRRKSPSIR